MNTRAFLRTIGCGLTVTLFFFCTSTSMAKSMEELQASFKARYSQLAKLKTAAKVGETDTGMVDAVQAGDAAIQKIVDAENADRAELYAALAKQQGTTIETVAKRNAMRNFSKAKPGEVIKKGGKWIKQ